MAESKHGRVFLEKNPLFVIPLFAAVIFAIAWGLYWSGARFESTNHVAAPAAPTSSTAAYENATYVVNGVPVTLVNGYAETTVAPGSASKLITRYFDHGTAGDLNGDGIPDIGFLLTQDGGGSGTFYYAVAALGTTNGYQGTNAVLLGDRIAPQTTEIRNGELIVNYADRAPGEPMSAKPTIGVTKYFRIENGALTEVSG